jgi:hypothetical protein
MLIVLVLPAWHFDALYTYVLVDRVYSDLSLFVLPSSTAAVYA